MKRVHIRRKACDPTRRTLLVGLAGSTALMATRGLMAQVPATVLTGSVFHLTIDTLPVNFTGRTRMATAVNGQVPAPLLRWRQGDTVTLHVTNRLSVPSSIHWHGLILPADMDGVPGLSFAGIQPQETFTYRFKVNQSGTYWYHAHSGFQEQTGLYGPIIIDAVAGARQTYDREYVVMLSDWSDQNPEHIYRLLKLHSGYFNPAQRTVGDFIQDVRQQGFSAALADHLMWGQMRMHPTDLADVSGQTYTYLMNGHTPQDRWTALFRRGDKLRLRFINGSSMSIFDVRIPGLKMTVIAADGQDVDPVTVDEFRIATAESYDVIVECQDDSAYTIFAQAMDRSGFACGSLSPEVGVHASVPALDPRPLLTMADMGMAHDMSHMNHDMHAMGGMDHSMMQHTTEQALQHASTEYGPTVDALATLVSDRLDDPGIGLRANGRRVLTYADLHTLGGSIDLRTPTREIELHLTGHMERFMWSFNGEPFSQAEPLRWRYGERIRIVLVNDSMMTHPIHLHGMWSELETPEGAFLVRKHTVMVQPGQRVRYTVTADAIGRWAYHCHLLYHMEAGMFREVIVAT